MEQKTKFEWSRIGDVALGRKNLGEDMPVAVYRLMQYTVMDTMEETLGREKAEEVMRASGYRAGIALAEGLLPSGVDFPSYVAKLQEVLKEMKIGILRFEKSDLENLSFVLTVSEDLDCSGLPVTGDSVCVYDEGLLAGIMYSYTGKQFRVEEVDCWATGDRTCRFTVDPIEE